MTMSVVIQFDKPRELKFGLKEVKELEAPMGGQPLGAIVQHLSQIGITGITLALYVGLKHEDKGLNPTLVTKMLETYIQRGGKLKKLVTGLSDAIEETGIFGKDGDDEEEEGEEGNGSPGRATSGR